MLSFRLQDKSYKLHAFMIEMSAPGTCGQSRKVIFQQNKQTSEWHLFADRLLVKVDNSEVESFLSLAKNDLYLLSYYEIWKYCIHSSTRFLSTEFPKSLYDDIWLIAGGIFGLFIWFLCTKNLSAGLFPVWKVARDRDE